MTLRGPLLLIFEKLRHEKTISLDAFASALDGLAVSTDEIDALMAALEAEGVTVTAPQGGGGEARLQRVVAAARSLRAEGLPLRADEVARRSGLSEGEVRIALRLVKVIAFGS